MHQWTPDRITNSKIIVTPNTEVEGNKHNHLSTLSLPDFKRKFEPEPGSDLLKIDNVNFKSHKLCFFFHLII